MSAAKQFEDLRVWQEARSLANSVYDVTRRLRDFDFRNQIRSAAVSVMNNIAEGFERRTSADFAHFLDVAKGSAGEVRSMLYLAEDLAYLQPGDSSRLRNEASAMSKGIARLASYVRSRSTR